MDAEERTAEQEIRELHEAWFAASRAKDLDASMAPISPSIRLISESWIQGDGLRWPCDARKSTAHEVASL